MFQCLLFNIPLVLSLVTVYAMCALYVLLICFVYDFRMHDTILAMCMSAVCACNICVLCCRF